MTSPSTTSTAFLDEVRLQWAAASYELEQAVARLDDWAQQDARERLDELRELMLRNDTPLDALLLGRSAA